MSTSYDIVVVGGGIVGASTAYHASARGAKTLLVDQDRPGQASAAGAGIVSPETSVREEPWRDFALAAGSYYPTLVSPNLQFLDFSKETSDSLYAP